MNTGSSFAKEAMEAKGKSEEKCKAFMDICKYFSEEEWAKLGNSEKITHVYMKRNYDTMTHLGLRANLPDFMRPKKQTTKSPEHDPDEGQNHGNQGE
ncbi:protein SSXA1-like [Pteronotus mesoamericanus]|uniref:protein SSXA1-like n=1 Tax=Pteronotus mesoamericanus TaxID=1884717 RepID=UPI0023ECD265|nr:protein SSXA1-like [Pteronotus parnellii mesoamericanus]